MPKVKPKAGVSGLAVRLARIARRMKLYELAAAIGVAAPTLSQYETGERPIPTEVANAIARVLCVPLEFFRKDAA